MTEATGIHYELSSKGRLETLMSAISDGLMRGESIDVLNDWWREAGVESARLAGETALDEGRPTVVIDGMEVPSAFSALVRQIENVQPEDVHDISTIFSSERDFTGAMDAAQQGIVDPRLTQLQRQWVEAMPRTDLHGLREGSIL